jgi:hypothetical protein
MQLIYKLLYTGIIISALLVSANFRVSAQSDTLIKEYAVENKFASDFKFKERYRYFTGANVEEKTLIKVGGSMNGGLRGGDGIDESFFWQIYQCIRYRAKAFAICVCTGRSRKYLGI